MTKPQFAGVIAYIASGIGVRLSQEALDVYFDMLGDLTEEVGYLAAKRVLTEHKWATFPSIAELRQAAVDSVRGEVIELPAAKAWELAWSAVKRIDLDIDGSKDRALAKLPKVVRESLEAFGLAAIIGGDSPVEVIRSQYLKIYEQLATRDRRAALLTPAIHNKLGEIRDRARRPVANASVQRIADQFSMPN